MWTTKAQISLRSLISVFVVRCLDRIIPTLASLSNWSQPRRQVFSSRGSFCKACLSHHMMNVVSVPMMSLRHQHFWWRLERSEKYASELVSLKLWHMTSCTILYRNLPLSKLLWLGKPAPNLSLAIKQFSQVFPIKTIVIHPKLQAILSYKWIYGSWSFRNKMVAIWLGLDECWKIIF